MKRPNSAISSGGAISLKSIEEKDRDLSYRNASYYALPENVREIVE
tara:strand:+ start:370 stop:507 length:138 start_codon:yes stop_codon:yes gene_type:complete